MRKPKDLARQELLTIVTQLQYALYLDCDEEDRQTWDPDKSWEAANICDDMAKLLIEPKVRQPSGRAPGVVGDVNDVHKLIQQKQAKGYVECAAV